MMGAMRYLSMDSYCIDNFYHMDYLSPASAVLNLSKYFANSHKSAIALTGGYTSWETTFCAQPRRIRQVTDMTALVSLYVRCYVIDIPALKIPVTIIKLRNPHTKNVDQKRQQHVNRFWRRRWREPASTMGMQLGLLLMPSGISWLNSPPAPHLEDLKNHLKQRQIVLGCSPKRFYQQV
jgi:hypothetical protein